jgi:putative pyruvate formate lyase activating enzyme
MLSFQAAYIKTFDHGLLAAKVEEAYARMGDCHLCPRKCGVNRLTGETGLCKTGKNAWVSSYSPHFGEEAPLVGSNGSGTIFFTHCNLMCLFCQNFDISHQGQGREVSCEQIAAMMLALQKQGCHNINFVTPSHVVPQILAAVEIAVQSGLNVPLIYNSGGYDRVATLRLLEDVFDIYMPDFKFWDSDIAASACGAPDYPETARKALIEMHRQVGDLQINTDGIAQRGLLVRHLVLPRGRAGTREVMRFIARQISCDSYVNIMSQYRPCGRAAEISGLDIYPSRADFREAVNAAKQEGIVRLDQPRRVFSLR